MIIVKINYCPSCGSELIKGSFICPSCSLDVEELFAKDYLLESNNKNNSIELFEGSEEIIIVDDEILDNFESKKSDDEIVIVISENPNNDDLVIDLDKLGIDVENIDGDINMVIQVDGSDLDDNNEFLSKDGEMPYYEWYFDNDPYGIVYYKFVNIED